MGRSTAAMIDYVSAPWQATGGLPTRPEGDDRFLSQEQLDYLLRCLADTQWLLADLDITRTKQDQFPTRPTPVTDPTEAPMPYREHASAAAADLEAAIIGVAGLLWHRATHGQQQPFRSAAAAASWLRSQPKLIMQDPDAEQYARRICDRHDAALDGPIEHPPCWRYLGKCERCGADLEAEDGADTVRCSCGYSERTSSVIERALTAADDMLMTDTQLVGALELDGVLITRTRIENWMSRGRLVVHRQRRWSRSSGRIIEVRTVRLGAVRELVADLEARRAGKRGSDRIG